MVRELGVLETPVRSGAALGGHAVLGPTQLRIVDGLEVGLADECRAVAVASQCLSHARRIVREWDSVRDHAVGSHVLPGQHGRPCRHAHGVLRICPLEPHAVGSEAVDRRGAGHCAAVAPEGVVALLVGRYEQDVASHGSAIESHGPVNRRTNRLR